MTMTNRITKIKALTMIETSTPGVIPEIH